MIIRIVRMEFKPEQVNQFLDLFENTKKQIRNFPGVLYLELLKDAEKEGVFYTLSHWRSVEDLEIYRNSPLFADVWAKTKILFADKPQAFSLNSLMKVSE